MNNFSCMFCVSMFDMDHYLDIVYVLFALSSIKKLKWIYGT